TRLALRRVQDPLDAHLAHCRLRQDPTRVLECDHQVLAGQHLVDGRAPHRNLDRDLRTCRRYEHHVALPPPPVVPAVAAHPAAGAPRRRICTLRNEPDCVGPPACCRTSITVPSALIV